MRLLILLLLILAGHPVWAQAPQTRVWLTVADHDSLDARIGDEYQVDVHIDTRGELISGLQLFWSFPEGIIEPVRWETTPGNLGWIQSNALFPYSILFSGHHQDRPLNEHMSGERLDWIVQTGTSQGGQRPVFSAVGILCSFHFRVVGAVDNHELGFDHINAYFRNSLYWRGSEDAELAFNQERPLVLNVLGITLDELPDVYLTGGHTVDSLNLYDYLDGSSSVDPAEVEFLLSPLVNTVCTLDTVRTEDAFWLIASDNGGAGEFVSVPVTATFSTTTATRNYRVFKGEPPRIADTLRSTDPFVRFFEDDSFLLPFDEYVEDPNNDVSTLDWTITEIDPSISLVINPVSHVGTFTALPDWNGTASVTVRVEDSIGMADVAVIQVLVLPVNDAPELDFGPDRLPVTPDRGLVIDLEEVTLDVDNLWNELFWSCTSDTSQVALRIDNQARTLSLVVHEDTPLFTPVDFVVRVDDIEGGADTDTLRILVNSHPPVWQPVEDVVFLGSTSATRSLDDYVSDEDNPDSQLQITARGQVQIQVSINSQTHLATFRSLNPSWRGVERVILTATDPDQNSAEDTLRAVSLLGNYPTVGDFDPLLLWPSQQVGPIALDDHVWDLDTPDAQQSWTIDHNQVFGIALDTQARTVMVSAPPVRGRFDWITWRATDPQGRSGSQTTVAVVIDTTGLPTVIPFRELVLSTFSSDSTLRLDEHVHDIDHAPAQMEWTVLPHGHLAGQLLAGRRLRVSSGSVTGRDTLRLELRDPVGNLATGFVPVRVIEGTPPVVSEFPPVYIIAGRSQALENLGSYVYDRDEGDVISWTFVPETSSPLVLDWDVLLDRLVIQTDPGHLGIDGFQAVAQDLSQNADSSRLEIHSLENVPPGVELGVLANGANPALLDLVALANERLAAPPTATAGALVPAFTAVNPGDRGPWLYRADLDLPDGTHRIHVLSRDIVGNESLDSLDLSVASLSGGAGLVSPDGTLQLSAGDGTRWTIVQPAGGEAAWKLLSSRSGSGVRATVHASTGIRLERLAGTTWQPVATRREGELLVVERMQEGHYRLAEESGLPDGFVLHPGAPNPFNPSTVLRLDLPERGPVTLVIHDLLGRRVAVLADGILEAGEHRLVWYGTNREGRPVASGMYVAQAAGAHGTRTQKLLLVR